MIRRWSITWNGIKSLLHQQMKQLPFPEGRERRSFRSERRASGPVVEPGVPAVDAGHGSRASQSAKALSTQG